MERRRHIEQHQADLERAGRLGDALGYGALRLAVDVRAEQDQLRAGMQEAVAAGRMTAHEMEQNLESWRRCRTAQDDLLPPDCA